MMYSSVIYVDERFPDVAARTTLNVGRIAGSTREQIGGVTTLINRTHQRT